jgi:sulfur carrier protein
MVKINGKEAADVCGITVSQYLSANNYNPTHIVVELNEEILPKTEYDSTAIADGDVVEILSFMGGG